MSAIPVTRRTLLATTAAVAAPLLAPPSAAAVEEDEAAATDALRQLITRERTAVVAYEALAAADFLDAPSATLFRTLREHEQEHADALVEALEERGEQPPEPPTREDVDGLDAVASQDEALEFGGRLEEQLVAAYLDAVKLFEGASLLETVGEILGSEGQHLVILRDRRRQDPVPSAFERGRPA